MSFYSAIFTVGSLGSFAWRNREKCVDLLSHHSTCRVVLVDRLQVGRHGVVRCLDYRSVIKSRPSHLRACSQASFGRSLPSFSVSRKSAPTRVQALGYELLHAHRLHRHGPRVEPELGQYRRVCRSGRQDGNVDALWLELVVKRFPETTLHSPTDNGVALSS